MRAVGHPPDRRGGGERRRDRAPSRTAARAWRRAGDRGTGRRGGYPRRLHGPDPRCRYRGGGRGRMSASALHTTPRGFSLAQYTICLKGIVWREGLRFLHQRERFVAALVRPLVWLFIFAAGFRQVLGVSIIPPYDTYVLYEVYIAPGLMAMIQMFN